MQPEIQQELVSTRKRLGLKTHEKVIVVVTPLASVVASVLVVLHYAYHMI